MSLFRNRPYVLIIIGGTIANVVYTVTVLSTTIYLQDGRGLSPMIAGLVFLAPSVAVALSGPLAGRLAAWQPVRCSCRCFRSTRWECRRRARVGCTTCSAS